MPSPLICFVCLCNLLSSYSYSHSHSHITTTIDVIQHTTEYVTYKKKQETVCLAA